MKMTCTEQRINHTDANGVHRMMVTLRASDGGHSLHLYLSQEDAAKYVLGTDYYVPWPEAVQ